MIDQNHLGSQCESLDISLEGHAHKSPQARMVKIRISAPEGRRDSIFSLKWPQSSHLYWTYEATYNLKCLFSEILAKNCFFGHCITKNYAKPSLILLTMMST